MGEFDEFEGAFKDAETAKPGSAVGRLPVGVYRGVCTMVDLEGDGKMVDKHIFGGGDKTKGLKIFIEILEPEKVGEVTTKGEIHEHVFWVTTNMLPYIKRDCSIILGQEMSSLNEIAKSVFAGRPVEFGLKDDTWNGFTRSKVSFFNTWDPKAPKADEKKTKQGAKGTAEKGKATEVTSGTKTKSDF